MPELDELIFHESPAVEFATNTFIGVPTILQYEDTPLIEVVRVQEARFTSQFRIYHEDGTYLAKVVGSRLFPNEAGKKAGLRLEYPPLMTVCRLGDRTLFEIRRKEAAALKTEAELYTPDGVFVGGNDAGVAFRLMKDKPLVVGTMMIVDSTVSGCPIGVHVFKDGGFAIGSRNKAKR